MYKTCGPNSQYNLLLNNKYYSDLNSKILIDEKTKKTANIVSKIRRQANDWGTLKDKQRRRIPMSSKRR